MTRLLDAPPEIRLVACLVWSLASMTACDASDHPQAAPFDRSLAGDARAADATAMDATVDRGLPPDDGPQPDATPPDEPIVDAGSPPDGCDGVHVSPGVWGAEALADAALVGVESGPDGLELMREELVWGGDFEGGSIGWQADGQARLAVVDTDGRHAAQITFDGEGGRVIQQRAVDGRGWQSGEHLRISAALRQAPGFDAPLRITGRLQYADGPEDAVEVAAPDHQAWAQIGAVLATAPGRPVTGVEVAIEAGPGAGTVWLDTLSLSARSVPRGTITSAPIDTGSVCAAITDATWGGAGDGEAVELAVRTGDTPDALAAAPWSPWRRGGATHRGRLHQFRLTLVGGATSPVIEAVTMAYGSAAIRVEGRVVDAVTGAAVDGATLWAGDRRLVRSDREGRFSARVPGPAPLTIRAPLYRTAQVDPTPGDDLHIALTPDGSWPMLGGTPLRHGATPLTGAMASAPGVLATHDFARGGLPRGVWVADLDADGAAELLMIQGERVLAYRGDGSLMWRSEGDAGREIGVVIGVADLDGDGWVEVVGGNQPSDDAAGMYRVGRLTVLNGQTGVVEYVDSLFDVYTGAGNAVDIRPGYATIADMDGDGALEVVVSSKYSHEFRVYDFSDGIAAGRLAWRGDWEGYRNYVTIAVGDVDGDGQAEVVGATTGRLVLLNAQGARYTPPMSDRNITVTANLFLQDLDGDGDDEIISLSYNPFALAVFDVGPDGVETLYALDLPGIASVVEGSVADFDGDGEWEIAYTRGSNTYVRDLLTGDEEYVGERRLLAGAADLTGDGVPELILARHKVAFEILSGPDYAVLADLPELAASRYTHPRLERWSTTHFERATPDPRSDYRTALPSVAVGDVDGDGVAELVARARQTRALIAVDVSGPAPVEKWRHQIEAEANFYVPADGVADLDGDGRVETVAVLSDGEVRILDDRGAIRLSLQTTEHLPRPRVADLDGDGINEIVISGRDPLSNPGDLRPVEVVGVTANGVDRRPFAFTDSVLHERGNRPVLVDVDGDGASELIGVTVEVRDGRTAYAVIALDATGQARWQTSNLGARVEHLAVGEFDGDGLPDLYVALVTGAHMALSGLDGRPLWSLDVAAGRYVPTSVDLSGDGIDDLAMVGGNDHFFGYSGVDGTLLFDVVHQALCNSGTLMAADLEGDGRTELVTSGNYGLIVAAQDGELIWEGLETEGNKWFYSALVDADDDGRLDVVHPSHHGVYVSEGVSGEPLWYFGVEPRKAATSVVVADVDGDGSQEVIVGIDGVLYALEKADGRVQWSVDLGARLGEPVVADVNGDGLAEILISTAGRLWVLGPTATPDLRVDASSLMLSTDRPQAGAAVDLRARVRNIGGASAERATVRLTADGQLVHSETVAIPAGGVVEVTHRWRASAGITRLGVDVEVGGEARVGDNQAERRVAVIERVQP